MRKLIEKYRRLPDFDAEKCSMIRLSDGQEWGFPRPMLELTPVFDGEITLPSGAKTPAATGFNRNVTLGAELDLLVEAIDREDDPARRVVLVMTLGALILKQAYDLEDADFERLFRYRVGDPESEAMLREIMDVATARISTFMGATT